MKTLIILILSISSFFVVNAQKLVSRNAHIWFYSHTPVEDIEAHNRQAVSILNTETGEIQFSLLIKSFEFQKKLMQEHFNENYMESDTWPKASFNGSIENIGDINFSQDGSYSANVTGNLTIRDVTRSISSKAKILVKNQEVSGETKFIVKPSDYNIEIPKVVEDKIAKEIEVNIDVHFNK